MATEEQISRVLMSLGEIQVCGHCHTRLRWGDFECPHCGADLDDQLRLWAQRVVEAVNHPPDR